MNTRMVQFCPVAHAPNVCCCVAPNSLTQESTVFKKLIAIVGTLLLAAGISVAVAAPASAHTPTHTVSCSTLTFKGTQYETRSGNATPNRATIVIDGVTVLDQWFGKTLDQKTFTFDSTTSHTWSIVVDAVGGTNDTQYDWKASGVTTPCSYPKKAMDVTCSAVSVDWGQALTTALHINMRVMTDGGEKTVNAYIDQNISGGYKTLGLRINGFDPIPLTEQQVKSGHLEFDYPLYLEKAGITTWAVVWVQVDDMHFNQDEKGEWIYCNWSDTQEDAYAEVTITPATCEAGESLVLGGTKFATWGKVDGAYTVIATADKGHLFPAGEGVSKDGTTKTFTGTLAGALDPNGPACATAVTPKAPALVMVTECGTTGSVTPVAVTGVSYVTDFTPATGAYTVTATPQAGYYFDGDADQVITFTGNVGAPYDCVEKPDATIASGECLYTADGKAEARTVTLTYDNSASNKATLFRVTSLSAYDRTVAAGAIETVTINSIGAAGVDYLVTAGSSSFELSVPACDEPVKPEPQTRQVVSETFQCTTSDVEVTTTTYTIDYVFNTTTKVWDAQPEVAGTPVVTTRAMTDDEKIAECGIPVVPVAPTLVTVTSCGVSGSVTPAVTDGVTYVTDFNPATGAYTVTATPNAGYSFSGDADQVIVFAGTVGAYEACEEKPDATIAYGECLYTADGAVEPRTVTITYDNSASNLPVLFQVTSLSAYDRTVAAGAIETVTITSIGAGGVDYTVTAGSSSFDLSVPACDEPVKPAATSRQVTTESFVCSSSDVAVTTITYTTDYAFDVATATWQAQPEVASAPVVTTRAMTADEVTVECATAVDTDPFVSSCAVASPTGAPSSTWIYVDFDPSVVYTITNTKTDTTVTASDFYTTVPAGPYTVRATAAPGYQLLPTAVEAWSYIVQDTANCDLPTYAVVEPAMAWTPPSCAAAGTLTVGEITANTISWTANGAPMSNGTYTVPAGETWVVQAWPTDSNNAMDAEWVDARTLSFDPVAAGCTELTTLALASTGSEPLKYAGAGILLLLAGLGILIVRRRKAASN